MRRRGADGACLSWARAGWYGVFVVVGALAVCEDAGDGGCRAGPDGGLMQGVRASRGSASV